MGKKYIQRLGGCILKMQILQKLLSRSKRSQSKSSEFLGGEGTHLENNFKIFVEKLTSQIHGIFEEENQNIQITFLGPININTYYADLAQGQAE